MRRIDEKFIARFMKLRRQFRKYSSIHLVQSIIDYLYHNFELRDANQIQKAPWAQMLLIKWIFLDEEYGRSRRIPTEKQFFKIINSAWKLQGRAKLPSDYPDLRLFTRALAYQQFSYQMDVSFSEIARQKVMFETLPKEHPLSDRFYGLCDLTFSEFIELAIMLIARVKANPGKMLSIEYFYAMENLYHRGKILRFFSAISLTPDDLRRYLLSECSGIRRATECYEENPINRYPLVRLGDKFLCWYPTVLFRCLETFIYDRLRQDNAARFMDSFGEIFERYVGRSIEEAGVKFVTERRIKPIIGDRKCVDFVVMDDEGIALIDAKGVALADYVMVTNSAQLIRERTRDTIINAIDQAHSVYGAIDSLQSEIPINFRNKNPYIVVVTYKEHYLGDGEHFAENIAKEKIAKIKSKYPGVEIPLKNIFCLSVNEFDCLCAAVKSGESGFNEIFERIISEKYGAESQSFTFMDYLRKFGLIRQPDWVREEFLSVCNKFEDALKRRDG